LAGFPKNGQIPDLMSRNPAQPLTKTKILNENNRSSIGSDKKVYVMLASCSHCDHAGGRPTNAPSAGSKPTWQSCVTLVGPDMFIADSRSSLSSDDRFFRLKNLCILRIYLTTKRHNNTPKWVIIYLNSIPTNDLTK